MEPFVALIAHGCKLEQKLRADVLVADVVNLFGWVKPTAFTESPRPRQHSLTLLLPLGA